MARFSLRWLFIGVALVSAYCAALASSSEIVADLVLSGLALIVTGVAIHALVTRDAFSLGFAATAIVYWLHQVAAYHGHGYEGRLSPHFIRWLLRQVHGDIESRWQPLTGVFEILAAGWLLVLCVCGGWFATWLAARQKKHS